MGEGRKQNASQKNQPEIWWTVISAWELKLKKQNKIQPKKKKKKKRHSHSAHTGITDHPWISVLSLSLGSDNAKEKKRTGPRSYPQSCCKTLRPLYFLTLHCCRSLNRTEHHGLLHENLFESLPFRGRSAEGETMTPSMSCNRHSEVQPFICRYSTVWLSEEENCTWARSLSYKCAQEVHTSAMWEKKDYSL